MAATVRPTPVLTPESVAGLICSTSEPSRNRRMASRQSPTSVVRVNASRSRSSWTRLDGNALSAEAVRMAIVDVVEMLSDRDPPSSA